MKNFTILFAMGVISSCANIPMDIPEQEEIYAKFVLENKLEKLERISTFSLSNWSELDKTHLILTASINKPYLITLKSNCYDLKFSQGIGIERSSSHSLDARFDSIFVPSFPERKCFIESIHKLTREQANALRKLE